MSHRLRLTIIVAPFCILLSALPGLAQTESATISGRISDTQGLAVSGARVSATNVSTGVGHTTETNAEGFYNIPGLPPGPYRVIVEKEGFAQIVKPDVQLHVQDDIGINFSLRIGSVMESVTVTGGAPLVDTSNTSVGTVVPRQFVENLPLNGRSFHSLFEITPGVVLTPTQEQGDQGQFAINGNRSDSNYFSIDGVSANFGITPSSELGADGGGALPALSALGGTNNLVSIDGLQEFRLETSGFAPEFGRGGAQLILVTRSGTNQIHGAVFDYLRNDIFDANDWFADNQQLPKPPIRQNDFGGVIGGPIYKNKSFFFFSYEGLRLRQPRVAITDVPSLYARSNAVPAAQPLLASFSLPNGPVTSSDGNGNPLTNQYSASYSDPASLDAYSLRIDQSLGSKFTLFGRFAYSPSQASIRASGGYAAISDRTLTSLTTQTNTIGLTAVITPHVTDDFRFNYSTDTGSVRFLNDDFGGAVPLPDSVAFPPGFGSSQTSNGGFYILGIRGGQVQVGVNSHNNRQHQLQFVDNTSILQGNHQWKFGFDFRRLSPTLHPRQYDAFPLFFSMQSVIDGVGDLWIIQNNTNTPEFLYHNYGAYAQDDWKISERLTLNYGLRWELNPPPSELTGHPLVAVSEVSDLSTMQLASPGTSPWHSGWGTVAPRIGASYLLRQNADWMTVVKGGFGIFHQLGTETTGDAANNFENPYARTLYPTEVPLPWTSPPPPVTNSLTPPYGTMVIFDPHLKVPYNAEWSLGVEQALGANQRVNMTYIGSIGRDLLRQNMLNSTYLPINPQFTQLYLTNNVGQSNYNALQVQYQHRLAHGLQMLASYTWSHSLDNGSSDAIYSYGYDDSAQEPSSFYNVHQDYGPSSFDIRNTFNAAITYQFPGQKIGNRALRHVAEGWALDAILHARSAPPFDVIYLPTVSKFYDDQTPSNMYFRADVVPGVPQWIHNSAAPGGRELNVAAFSIPVFATPADSRQGTLGRNALRAYSSVQQDLSVRREFAIREQVRLIFRMDAFNIFNHPNFGYPQSNLSLDGFGQPYSTLAQTLGSGNGFGGGFNPLYAVGGPRSMQASLKLQF
jgi:Carboxypeptidase regulatory-like domain